MNPLKAGDIAPKFSLPDQDGEQVNLTDFQGQRVHAVPGSRSNLLAHHPGQVS